MLTYPHYTVLFTECPPTTYCCALITSRVQHVIMAENPLLLHRSFWTQHHPTEPHSSSCSTCNIQHSESLNTAHTNPPSSSTAPQHTSPGAVGNTATTSKHTSLNPAVFHLSASSQYILLQHPHASSTYSDRKQTCKAKDVLYDRSYKQ